MFALSPAFAQLAAHTVEGFLERNILFPSVAEKYSGVKNMTLILIGLEIR